MTSCRELTSHSPAKHSRQKGLQRQPAASTTANKEQRIGNCMGVVLGCSVFCRPFELGTAAPRCTVTSRQLDNLALMESPSCGKNAATFSIVQAFCIVTQWLQVRTQHAALGLRTEQWSRPNLQFVSALPGGRMPICMRRVPRPCGQR